MADDDYDPFADPGEVARAHEEARQKLWSEEAACRGPPPARQQPPPLGRKARILGLHGGSTNSNVMRYQAAALQRALGDQVEWDFLDGGVPGTMDANPMIKALAEDKPLVSWYTVECEDTSDRPFLEKLFDMSVTITYDQVEVAAERVLEYIKINGPFDILLGFSQGCIVSHLICGLLRERGEEVPWRLSVLFNGMRVRDSRYHKLFDAPLTQPTVMVFGKADEYYDYGRQSQTEMYKDPVILEHEEGHKFPGKPPRAKEIYNAVVQEVRWYCGLPAT